MSPSARHSSMDRYQHVALIVESSHASGRGILKGIARYMRLTSVRWSIFHQPRGLERDLTGWLDGWRGDGIIVRAQNARLTEAVLETGIPAVDVLGVAGDPRLPLVHVDNRLVARLAADHFLERGFRNFAYCGIPQINWSEDRGRGFHEAVGEKSAPFWLQEPGALEDWEQEQDRLAAWLQSLAKPVAVMACNDPRGQRVLEAARRIGALVPEEIAVVGVDNDRAICEISVPQLSSIDPGHSAVGYHAAALLTRMMQGESAPAETTLLAPLGCITRLSSDILAIDDSEVVQAVAFIREHACDPIGVENVVEHVSISRSALKRRFAKHLGRGVHDEIIRVRMEKARQLLTETDLPMDQVAILLGYEHVEYFSVAFRRENGEPPSQYRKRVGGTQVTNEA